MPELPEVHTTATELRKLVVGKTITDVWSGYNSPHYYGKEQVKDPVYFIVDRIFGKGTTPGEVASYLVSSLVPAPTTRKKASA